MVLFSRKTEAEEMREASEESLYISLFAAAANDQRSAMINLVNCGLDINWVNPKGETIESVAVLNSACNAHLMIKDFREGLENRRYLEVENLENALEEVTSAFDKKKAEYEAMADLATVYDERAAFLTEAHALRVRLMKLKNYDWDADDLAAQEASLLSRLKRDLDDNRRKRDDITASEQHLSPKIQDRLQVIRSAKKNARETWRLQAELHIKPDGAQNKTDLSIQEESVFIKKLGARYEKLRTIAAELIELQCEENQLLRPTEEEHTPGGFKRRISALYSDKLKEVSALSEWDKFLQNSIDDKQSRIAAIRRDMRDARSGICGHCGQEKIDAKKCDRCDYAFFCNPKCQTAAQRSHVSECSSYEFKAKTDAEEAFVRALEEIQEQLAQIRRKKLAVRVELTRTDFSVYQAKGAVDQFFDTHRYDDAEVTEGADFAGELGAAGAEDSDSAEIENEEEEDPEHPSDKALHNLQQYVQGNVKKILETISDPEPRSNVEVVEPIKAKDEPETESDEEESESEADDESDSEDGVGLVEDSDSDEETSSSSTPDSSDDDLPQTFTRPEVLRIENQLDDMFAAIATDNVAIVIKFLNSGLYLDAVLAKAREEAEAVGSIRTVEAIKDWEAQIERRWAQIKLEGTIKLLQDEHARKEAEISQKFKLALSSVRKDSYEDQLVVQRHDAAQFEIFRSLKREVCFVQQKLQRFIYWKETEEQIAAREAEILKAAMKVVVDNSFENRTRLELLESNVMLIKELQTQMDGWYRINSKECLYCGMEGEMSHCDECEDAFFCSRKCQVAAIPFHKAICRFGFVPVTDNEFFIIDLRETFARKKKYLMEVEQELAALDFYAPPKDTATIDQEAERRVKREIAQKVWDGQVMERRTMVQRVERHYQAKMDEMVARQELTIQAHNAALAETEKTVKKKSTAEILREHATLEQLKAQIKVQELEEIETCKEYHIRTREIKFQMLSRLFSDSNPDDKDKIEAAIAASEQHNLARHCRVFKDRKCWIRQIKKNEKKLQEVDAELKQLRAGKCGNCDVREKLKKCSQCEYSYYCSRKCQVAAWAVHKGVCGLKEMVPTTAEEMALCRKKAYILGVLEVERNNLEQLQVPTIKLSEREFKAEAVWRREEGRKWLEEERERLEAARVRLGESEPGWYKAKALRPTLGQGDVVPADQIQLEPAAETKVDTATVVSADEKKADASPNTNNEPKSE